MFKKSLALILVITGGATMNLASAETIQPRKFLVFDSGVSLDEVRQHGPEYVFVWGSTAGKEREKAWLANAGTIRSTYFPFERDPYSRPLAQWEDSHPDWIARRCDGSPAYLYNHPIVPLDIANPAVVQWQIQQFVSAPLPFIALDNFQTSNYEHICGVTERNGTFQRLYQDSSRDAAFTEAKVKWLETVSDALHQAQKKVVINYSLDIGLRTAELSRIVSAVDAVLQEDYGQQRKDPVTLDSFFRFHDLVGGQGKAYYTIYQIEPVSAGQAESAMATYLMTAGPSTAVNITGTQRYGTIPDWFGLDRPIGAPCGPRKATQGWITRIFSGGMAVLRVPHAGQASYSLPAGLTRVNHEPAGPQLNLAAGEGAVLYSTAPNLCH